MFARYALLATSDKTSILELARGLQGLGWGIMATAGTTDVLSAHGIPVTPIIDITEVPEMFTGRVKTFHHRIFGGLLYRRDDPAHRAEVIKYSIPSIDLVACNFYPFDEVVVSGNLDLVTIQEFIDVGGPSLIRASAKNFQWVIPLVDPNDYMFTLNRLRAAKGDPMRIPFEYRQALAAKAFQHTANYDTIIGAYFSKNSMTTELKL